MRRVLRAAWQGISLAAVVYLMDSIVLGLADGTGKFTSGYGMARVGAAVILIGIGFGIPSLIYETELRMWLKIFIHMGIGCLVMTGASMLGGWLPVDKGLSAVLIALVIEAVIAFILLGVNILIATAEARRLNQKIKEQQQKE